MPFDNPSPNSKLTDSEIITRSSNRRSFLTKIGVSLLGAAAALIAGVAPSSAGDQKRAADYKRASDYDATQWADSKFCDSDPKDAACDHDFTRYGDMKHANDADVNQFDSDRK
jgi:hypothetical protein